jgi:hypothetical protein
MWFSFVKQVRSHEFVALFVVPIECFAYGFDLNNYYRVLLLVTL